MQKVFEQEHHEHESLIECLLGVWSVDIERFYLPFSNNRFILALLHIYNVIGLSTKEFLAIKKNEVKRSKRSGSRKESRERKKTDIEVNTFGNHKREGDCTECYYF